MNQVRFLFDGRRLRCTERPWELNMETVCGASRAQLPLSCAHAPPRVQGDSLDAMMEQLGD